MNLFYKELFYNYIFQNNPKTCTDYSKETLNPLQIDIIEMYNTKLTLNLAIES